MSLLRDYDVQWPSSTIQLLSYSDSLNLGISITAPQCFVPGYNFLIFYIATMAQPVGVSPRCVALLSHQPQRFQKFFSNARRERINVIQWVPFTIACALPPGPTDSSLCIQTCNDLPNACGLKSEGHSRSKLLRQVRKSAFDVKLRGEEAEPTDGSWAYQTRVKRKV